MIIRYVFVSSEIGAWGSILTYNSNLFVYLNHTQWYSREHKTYNGLENKQ